MLIEDPVWIDQNGDTLPEINERVGYVSGYNINLKASFEVKIPSGEPLEDVIIQAENKQLGLVGSVSVGNIGGDFSTLPFDLGQFQGGLTQYFSPDEPFKLEWSYSSDGGAYQDIGVSKHTVYVTLEEKSAELDKVYLSYLHWSTSNPGATTKSEVVQKTWQHFASKKLTAWNGRKLHYYPLGGHPDDRRGWPEYCLTSPSGYGQCDNFAFLLSDTLMINDITHLLISVTTKTLGVHPQKGGIREWMLIKNWTLTGEPSFSEETEYQWKLQLYKRKNNPELGSMISPETGSFMPDNQYGDFVNENGLPGQNTVTPSEKFFEEHQMVKITESLPTELGPYFDPSYGVTFQNQLDFEKQAVYGYGYGELSEEDENEEDKLNFKIRKAEGLDNIQFTSTSPY